MAKKKTFSVVKAVKRNARTRVGQPKPKRVIEDSAEHRKEKPRFKETLADLLRRDPDEGS